MSSSVSVGEDFCCKGLQFGAVLPGVRRQTSFQASLGEEGLAVPAPFDGNLGEQKAATITLRNHEAMASHDNVFRIDSLERGKNAYINLQVRRFFSGHSREARIVECGRLRRLSNCAVERVLDDDVADTAAQFAVQMQSCECTARLGKVLGRRSEVESRVLKFGSDAEMRQVEQDAAFFG